MDDDYQYAGKLSEFEEGNIVKSAVTGVAVASIGGKICAFTDFCTHEAVSFTGGYGVIFENYVICMLHTSVFDPETGESTQGPAYDPLGIFDVKVEGEDVYVARTRRNGK